MNEGAGLNVLVVCTANQCRSPLIEFALRRRCEARGLRWSIASAGTRALAGRPPHPLTTRLLEAHGDDVSGWRSRLVDAPTLAAADLVLTATVDNRNELVRLRPLSAALLFPFRQLADCAARRTHDGRTPVPASSVRRALAHARAALPASPRDADLPDPMGRRFRTFRRLDHLVEQEADALFAVLA